MRRSAAYRSLAVCIPLLLALGGTARADRILGENGRELLAPDGRTLVDKQDGFSIVLPASNWKVHFQRYEPFEGDSGFMLLLASPDGEVRLRIHEKTYRSPVPLEFLKMLLSKPEPRVRSKRSEIVQVAGMKCLENEGESQAGGDRWLHDLRRLCDRDPGRKFAVEIFPGVPVEQWPAEEKALRELVESFRILHE